MGHTLPNNRTTAFLFKVSRLKVSRPRFPHRSCIPQSYECCSISSMLQSLATTALAHIHFLCQHPSHIFWYLQAPLTFSHLWCTPALQGILSHNMNRTQQCSNSSLVHPSYLKGSHLIIRWLSMLCLRTDGETCLTFQNHPKDNPQGNIQSRSRTASYTHSTCDGFNSLSCLLLAPLS